MGNANSSYLSRRVVLDFELLLIYVMNKYPVWRLMLSSLRIVHSKEEDARWNESKRGFCHFDPEKDTVACTRNINFLPPRARLGIFLHEMGHTVLKGVFLAKQIAQEEVAVDQWATDNFPETGYTYADCEYYGKDYALHIARNLQTVSEEFAAQLLKGLSGEPKWAEQARMAAVESRESEGEEGEEGEEE